MVKRYLRSKKMPYKKQKQDMIILREDKDITLDKKSIFELRTGGFPKFYCDYLEKINPLIQELRESLKADKSGYRFLLPYAEIPENTKITWSEFMGKKKHVPLFSGDILYSDKSAREFYVHNRKFEISSPKVVIHSILEDILHGDEYEMSNKSINILRKVIRKLQDIQI